MATSKKKSTKRQKTSIAAPVVRNDDRGNRVPAIDVRPPPLYYRMPKRLHTPESLQPMDDKGRRQAGKVYRPVRDEAYEMVNTRWWNNIPSSLADRYLTPAFSGSRPIPEQAGASGGWLTVRGIGSPSKWTPEQREAWSTYQGAVAQSILDAESQYHEEVSRLLKAQREEEKARKARERAEAAEERARRQAQHEAERVEAAEQARRDEWARLVQKHGQRWASTVPKEDIPEDLGEWAHLVEEHGREGAAFELGVRDPSKLPVVQAHIRKMSAEATAQQRQQDKRFSLFEIDPNPSPVQRARIVLADKLRDLARMAISPEEKRKFYRRLDRVEKKIRDVEHLSLPERTRHLFDERDRVDKESLGRRIRFADSSYISPEQVGPSRVSPTRVSPSRVSPTRVSPSRVSPTRVSPSRVSPSSVDHREIEGKIASAHGRYSPSSSTPELTFLPEDVVKALDAEARERAVAAAGPADRDNPGPWRARFKEAYERIKKELWTETAARLAQEEGEREFPQDSTGDGRFTLLEID